MSVNSEWLRRTLDWEKMKTTEEAKKKTERRRRIEAWKDQRRNLMEGSREIQAKISHAMKLQLHTGKYEKHSGWHPRNLMDCKILDSHFVPRLDIL